MTARLDPPTLPGPWLLTGASGWFGRSALFELERILGPERLREQVIAFASTEKNIDFGSPLGPLQAIPLQQITQVDHPRGLLHLAFLTREKVVLNGVDSYVKSNRAITAAVADVMSHYPKMPIITTSSGAVAQAADLSLSAADPYARLKREEELLWQRHSSDRMAIVFRVYAATGRFLKDPSLFALGDFIRQAQAGGPIVVRSPRTVIRSYVHIGTLMRLAWLMLMQPLSAGYRQIDAVTDTLSLDQLADIIARKWHLPPPCLALDPDLVPDDYSACSSDFVDILERYQLASPDLDEQIDETATSIGLAAVS